MKTKLLAGILIIMLAACNSGSKQAQLDKLKKERDGLNEQIKKLEDEVAKEGKKDSLKSLTVGITDIKAQEFSHYVEVQGRVDGDENVGVYPKNQGGVVVNVFVKTGDNVKKGQVLAQIDDQILRQSIKGIQTQLDFATDMFNKQKRLWDQNIGSEVQFNSAKTQKEALESQKASLVEQIDMCKIVSPIDGSVEEKNIKIGQVASPASPVPTFRIVNFSNIKVVADVAEAFSAKLKKDNDVLLFFPDINKEINTKLSFSSKFINQTNRTFSIEIKLQSGDIEYRANMISIIKIKDYEAKQAITIPINVIQADGNNKYVFVAQKENNNFIAKKRIVKLGQSYNGIVEIIDGLKEGEKIISAGFQSIEDGQPVKF